MWALTAEQRAQHARHRAGHRSPSETGARSTHQTPSGNSAARSTASCPDTACATRVLPMPPAPTTVTTTCAHQQLLDRLDVAGRGRRAPAGAPERWWRLVPAPDRRNGFHASQAKHRRTALRVRPDRRLRRTPRAARSDSPVPGIVASALGPRSLRNAEICTCRLFSSTTRPGHTSVRSSFLVTSRARARDQRDEQVESARSQRDRLAVGQQAMLPGLEGKAAEAIGRRFEGRRGRGHGRAAKARAESISPPRRYRRARIFQRRLRRRFRTESGLQADIGIVVNAHPPRRTPCNPAKLVRAIAAAASIVLVALALMGASWYADSARQAATPAMVGVPTGEYVNGVEVQRLPSITVTARRSDVEPDSRPGHSREGPLERECAPWGQRARSASVGVHSREGPPRARIAPPRGERAMSSRAWGP